MDHPKHTPFWLVWNPDGREPQYRHVKESEARAEAGRLARLNPGRNFYVLQPISVTFRQDVVTHDFDDIPL